MYSLKHFALILAQVPADEAAAEAGTAADVGASVESGTALAASVAEQSQLGSLPLLIAGWLLVATVVVIAVLNVWAMRRRLRFVREVRDGEIDLLQQRILAAREERRVLEGRAEGWNGFANFVVSKKQPHGDSGICSFFLRPQNHRLKLPPFFPGQHLVFQLPSESGERPLTRRYSLSDCPQRDYYRISVKLAQAPADTPSAPPGRGSSYFHGQVSEEAEDRTNCHLLVAAPQGSFHINTLEPEPLVLIGGGVGVTPILSMFNAILDQNPGREVWFFYGVRNSAEDVLFDPGILHPDYAAIVEDQPGLQLRICYSQPLERDQALLEGRPDLYSKGRVTLERLKQELPSNNYRFYICGPDPMMDQLEHGLEAWDVPEEHIHSERFGPPPPGSNTSAPAAEGFVTFSRSGKTVAFSAADHSLLEAAERAGVPISNDCRAGSCGECKTALQSGEVSYPHKTSFKCAPGECLVCSCLPQGDVTLDC